MSDYNGNSLDPKNTISGGIKKINIPLVRRIQPQLMNNYPVLTVSDVLPVPTSKKKKQLRSIDDDWES